MRKLYYMGLEPYKARYTLQLQEWNTTVFDKKLNEVFEFQIRKCARNEETIDRESIA